MENKKYTRLNEYLEEARDSKPVASLQDIEAHIRQRKVHASGRTLTGNKLNLKYLIIMTSTVLITLALITQLSLHNPTQKTSPPLKESSSQREKQSASAAPLVSNPDKTPDTKTSSGLTSLKFTEVQGIKLLELSDKDLNYLGIKVSYSGVNYRNIIPAFDHRPITEFVYYNSKNNAGFAANDHYKGNEKGQDFYPVFFSYIKNNHFTTNYSADESKEFEETSPYFQNTIKGLVPVLVKQSALNLQDKGDIVFWFNTPKSFYDVLPSNLAAELQKAYPNTLAHIVKKASDYPENLAAAKDKGPIPSQIGSIKLIELSQEELAKLDINISGKGIYYENIIPYTKLSPRKTKLSYYNDKSGYGISVKSPFTSTGSGHDFYPIFLSQKNGYQKLKYDFESGSYDPDKWSDSFFLATIPTLVPVLVKQSEYSFSDKEDLILWYNVTPSFLNALPDRIAEDMRKEYANVLQNTGISGISTDNAPVKCQYFDACQSSLERFMKLNIYPNPAKEKLILDFKLPDGNTAMLYIASIEGKVINTVPAINASQNDQHVELNTSSIKPGIYLVNIKLSSGSTISKRVIILGAE